MSEPLVKLVVNCETGEQNYIPLTADEIALREAEAIIYEKQKTMALAEAEAKAEAKASAVSKLAALGLSEAEIAAIIGA